MGASSRREFLGWSAPFLPRAVARFVALALARELEPARCVVALPGRRAARRFEELLAESAPSELAPPRIVTEGELASALSEREVRVASSSARTLAWIDALRAAPRERLARAVAVPDSAGEDSLGGWLATARAVAAPFEALAAEELDFRAVAERGDLPLSERERFEVLADVQARYEATLARQGRIDPARAASEVARSGALRDGVGVVLAALPELSRSQRALLAHVRGLVRCFVFAPEDERDGFDEWGAVAPSAWATREIALAGERWRVVEDVRAMARDALDWLRAARGEFAAEDVTLGALDATLPAHFERAFALHGLRTRVAVGAPFARTPPASLLRALQDHARTRSFASFAALVRHPDLESSLLRELEAPASADALHVERLPSRVGEHAAAPSSASRRVAEVEARLEAFAGPLLDDSRRPLATWTRELQRLLPAVYPDVERDPRDAAAWERAHAVLALADALGEVQEAAELAEDAPPIGSADALELVLSRAERASIPEPPRAGAIEVLGWLELALDEAPELYVGGFAEGAVPQPPRAESLLPDALRRALGLPDEAQRVARDAYLTTAILASRPRAVFASARRSADGEPLRPSRLVFHCAPVEAPARVRAFFGRAAAPPRARTGSALRALERPFASFRVPERLRVTSFETYLRSPYEFYLRYVLELETCDDSARELDPLAFGNLAHDVLASFGADGIRDSTDEVEIAAWLSHALDRHAAQRYGRAPMVAVRMQFEQLRLRLAAFARWQAAERRSGWTIERAEYAIDGFALDVDGVPQLLTGRIDRIDRHAESGAWRVLDYKAGEKPKRPAEARTKAQGWLDLQLPLYREMLRGELGTEPQLGYVVLPADPRAVGAHIASWSAVELDEAVENAREIVRELRSGALPARGRKAPRERVFAALEGWGVLGAATDATRDEGEDREDGEEPA